MTVSRSPVISVRFHTQCVPLLLCLDSKLPGSEKSVNCIKYDFTVPWTISSGAFYLPPDFWTGEAWMWLKQRSQSVFQVRECLGFISSHPTNSLPAPRRKEMVQKDKAIHSPWLLPLGHPTHKGRKVSLATPTALRVSIGGFTELINL